MRALALALPLLLFACSDGDGDDDANEGSGGAGAGFCAEGALVFDEPGVATATPVEEIPVEGSACGAIERRFELVPSPHVSDCSQVEYASNPPTSGPHYGHWASYLVYEEPVPRGFYVHSMEHGGVTLLYSCDDCGDEITSAKSVIDALPTDPLCTDPESPRRVILTPDPLLETRWAAASWGFSLTADCFEPEVFDAFARAHYGHGSEAVCGGGVAP